VHGERGAGSFVKRRPSDRLAAHVPMPDLSAAMGSYEVRFVLETRAASLAAERRSAEQLSDIERAMDRLRLALMSSDAAHAEDMALHRTIVLATANPVFVSVFDHMHDDINRIMRAGIDISRSRPPEAIEAMLSEHELVVEAIRTREPDAAALAMHWHLWQGRKRLMP
jgi:GntR family transcriptional repressor for pyruvate dehydrogenase complex